ncbi:MAG: DeoR/GlpR transcriptional regulator [Spirochaetes bacterium]|nr:MAG: DeoR/GlpR transcriptional regulator [Spirochaetota bacterium]
MPSSGLIPADRQARIFKQVREKGLVKVADLSQMLDVSEITIRRDLDVLERKGVLERTHGGAICSQRMRIEPMYTQKDQTERAEKEAIGRAAQSLIEDGDTLLVNSGSTTLQVIRFLEGKNLRLITSNVGAIAVAGDKDIELILIGGVFRRQSNSLVGGLAALSLNQVYGSKAFIGVDGISVKYGLTTPIHQEAEIARHMIERTRGPVIVVADHTKLGVVSNFVTAPIDSVNILVTDEGFDEDYRSDLEKAGVEIVIARVKSKD